MDFKLLGATFLEGLLSFVSPCVLPMIPLYMSYLAGENKSVDENGNITYKTGKVFFTTLFFVLGIATTFLILGLSLNIFSDFLNRYNEVISIIGGVLLVLFGLHECGLIHIDVLNKELRLKFKGATEKMNVFKAYLLGLVFSLGWSPCIGPMLANALLLAATSAEGYLHIVFYGLGLIIPFLLTGLFTNKVLNFISRNRKFMSYTAKIAGIVLLCFGFYMIREASIKISAAKELSSTAAGGQQNESFIYEQEFKDQNGNPIKLEDLKGDYVLLNFATTWCTYCNEELPDLETFDQSNDAKCYVVMSPLNETGGQADIDAYLKEKNLSLPVIIDDQGLLFYYCSVSSYPTTFVLGPDGKFICYANGAMNVEGFNGLLDYAKQMYEKQ